MANKQTDECGTHFPSCGPTQRAQMKWESPRYQAGCVAKSWFRKNGVPPSHSSYANDPINGDKLFK